jgi:hypothetical protein
MHGLALFLRNFTARDLAATSFAFFIGSLFLVVPGYVLGTLLDSFGFTRRSTPARIAISLCLSVSVVPITLYYNWRFLPEAPWLLCGVTWILLPPLLFQQKSSISAAKCASISKYRKRVFIILAGWLFVGGACLVDLQIGNRLYFQWASFDYMLRAAVTASIARTGVPPLNPYFYFGHGFTLSYHYFWYLVCAQFARTGGSWVTGRIAVMAGTLWCGLALMAFVALSVHILEKERPPHCNRQTFIAVTLLGITGLDILPALLGLLLTRNLTPTTEWWNEQVTSWLNLVFWHPHSVAALVANGTAMLLLLNLPPKQLLHQRVAIVGVASAALASGAGLSIYVTVAFAVSWLGWIVVLALRKCGPQAIWICITAIAGLLMAMPYLLDLSHSGAASSGVPISFAIRRFFFMEAVVKVLGGGVRQVTLANALTLPLNYFLEFGFFFVVGVRQWQRIRARRGLTNEDALLSILLVSSIVVGSFFRSNAIASNDLGWRALIPAQFVLLIWASRLWDDGLFATRAGQSRAITVPVLLVLGAMGPLYDLAMLRVYPVLADHMNSSTLPWLVLDHHIGERTYAMRQTYERLDTRLPREAIVQQNPIVYAGDPFYGLYADRQTVAQTADCGIVFGGELSMCPTVLAPLWKIFIQPEALPFASVQADCRALSIDVLIVKDTDPAWRDKSSWVWREPALLSNAYSRVFSCLPKHRADGMFP